MKKVFFYFLSFTVLLSGFSVLFPATSKAASVYDDVITIQDDPMKFGNSTITKFEFGEYLTTVNWGSGCSAIANDFFTSLENQTINFFTTTVVTESSPNNTTFLISFINKTESISTNFTTNSLDLSSSTPFKQLRLDRNNTTDFTSCSSSLTNIRLATSLSNTAFGWYKPVETNFDGIVYPPDYEGQIFEPTILNGDVYRPEIGYFTTTENVIKAVYTNGTNNEVCIPVGLVETTGCVQPLLRWKIMAEDGTTELTSSVKDLFQPFDYKFPAFGTYYLDVSFTHPGTPYAPFSPEITLQSTRIEIDANGTFLTGGTGANECSVVGSVFTCSPASPFEDCTTYGLDIIGGFGCVINNFGIWLRNTLIDLFVPNSQALQASLDNFTSAFQSQLGFLYTAFNMLVQWITSLLIVTPRCDIDFGSATFFGATIDINFCAFEQSAPTIYNPIMTMTRLLLAAGFIFIAQKRLIEIIRGMGR